MTRPLTSRERTAENRRRFYSDGETTAIQSRGEGKGAAENWLRRLRKELVLEERAGRSDVWDGFALVCRLFLAALQQRAKGDPTIWNDTLRYAHEVTTRHPPT
ncbi:hypothetical protein Kpho02_59820 [Kitasatospora phosalacinea]|uniref:Uncharacterized protein n=1 Tax=Kitasatospora phosalacinea TaxID=2065 RepID=A0A9W6V2Y3_9ACTN|nr:hypothetical protein [Kitasatospora phosalacinea]GLW73684.1 hypothetical protein Kpho02_59820 [Kitasatospora phosalacinea]